MKNSFLILLLLVGVRVGYAQPKETFDIATFVTPAGWQREAKDFAVSFTKTNNVSRGWARVSIYKSIASSGNALTDFNSEWNALITKSYSGTTQPQPESTTEDGWTSQSGVSKFKFNNEDAYALLSTISGYGVEMSIMVLMNNQEFMSEIDKFLGTIDLKKPAVSAIVTPPVNAVQTQPTQSTAPVTTQVPANHGITISTTNFDDGWVAQPMTDYVRVAKGNVTVLLHFGIQITDEMRNSNSMELDIFNRFVGARYSISNVRQFQNEPYTYNKVYFFEADAIDKSSNKSSYLGFRIIVFSGIATCIEIIAPTAADFQAVFPNQEKVAAMTNYNKFAVTATDLLGTWEESSGSHVNLYNTVTGAYAGMNSSSSAHKFIFKTDGKYESNHKGAFGMVGNMKFYDQKYNGNSTVTNWDITLTNRFEGKTDIYWAQFEAVKGGRMLVLTDKSASAMRYQLVKTQ